MTPREGLTTVDSEIIALAEDEYAAAAESARIEVREIHTAAEAAEAALLLDEVWSVDETGTNVLEPGLIVAFAHAGNYVSAAYSLDEPDEMIGVTIGFFGQPLGTVMHSHIAGVRHQVIGRGAGSAMKLHQRLWCLNLGITEMTWTFDPLVARNAYFNFQRLGVGMVEYLEDFYGQMRDGVNAGQASDRMVVSWPLDKPPGPPSPRRTMPSNVCAVTTTVNRWSPRCPRRPVWSPSTFPPTSRRCAATMPISPHGGGRHCVTR
ncbi:hypothetical protein PGC08_15850 [Brevibacterium sp. BDJS002]|uniref:hypothetical protein n=1 Tax=Brevibacterium sp. BDJS002 TaxID=3020906 RepID=UPI0023080242|nr:hypothetical protein [Brevibacterium sp. BDJS002]WCE39460.1 hypothetical protein PGC08_15850 [Brevibacterium sp. BDJS002]